MKDEKKLREEIDELVASLEKQAATLYKPPLSHEIITSAILTGKIAALADIVSKRNEIISRRLVWLTAFLLLFTVALLAVEVRAVFFP